MSPGFSCEDGTEAFPVADLSRVGHFDRVLQLVTEHRDIQALDRTRPVLALQPHVPERQTHDYIRHGTTTLYAALRLLDGVVIGVTRGTVRKSSSRFSSGSIAKRRRVSIST